MSTPPKGVDDVFAAVMCLLAGVVDTIETKKSGAPKDTSWGACKKQMMGNVNDFMKNLLDYKRVVDEFQVPKINWKTVQPFLELEHFNFETINGKNPAAGGLTKWCLAIVKYYHTITGVEPKKRALAEAKATLEDAQSKLKIVNDKVAELEEKLGISIIITYIYIYIHIYDKLTFKYKI